MSGRTEYRMRRPGPCAAWVCDACGEWWEDTDGDPPGHEGLIRHWKYCPSCGRRIEVHIGLEAEQMAMPRATVDDVMRWGPCGPYNRERVEELWAGRESLSVLEILDLDIPAADLLRFALNAGFVADYVLHEFACRVAEHILLREREMGREPDPRSWAAVAAKRDWLAGEIGDAALRDAEDAARNAAWAAARTAAWNAAWEAARTAAWNAAWEAAARAAAWDAAWAAARAAAWAARAAARAAAWAARDVEKADQLEILRELLKEEVE